MAEADDAIGAALDRYGLRGWVRRMSVRWSLECPEVGLALNEAGVPRDRAARGRALGDWIARELSARADARARP